MISVVFFESLPRTRNVTLGTELVGARACQPPVPNPRAGGAYSGAAVMPDGGPLFPKAGRPVATNGVGLWVEAFYFGYLAFRCQLSLCYCSFGISRYVPARQSARRDECSQRG